MEAESLLKRTWAEVDLDAIAHNYRLVRQKIRGGAKLCCVVKANAYGHGALTLSRFYEQAGADFLAVSNLDEALELRRGGIGLPILILGFTPPENADVLAKYHISQCVFSYDYAKALSLAASAKGVCVKAHFKVDTGMGRIGFDFRNESAFEESLSALATAASMDALIREGIFTHFSSADEGTGGRDFTQKQFKTFVKVYESLAEKKITFTLRHAANSAAILDYPETHLDMVRAGIVLYGLLPSGAVQNRVALRQAITLKSAIDLIKEIDAGESISYGRTFVAEAPMRIATLPIGYADGLWRMAGERGFAPQLHGEKAPLVGRICMDQCMVDVTHIPEAKLGDEVTIYGGNGESVEDFAARLGTIGYEIVCALGERVPRAYIQNGEPISVLFRTLS